MHLQRPSGWNPVSLAFAALILAVVACSGDTTGPSQNVAFVELAAPPVLFMLPGETQQLQLRMKNGEGDVITGRTATWTTSNPSVATVSASGLLTTIGAGTALVEGSVDSYSARFTIEVANVDSVAVIYPQDIFEQGDVRQLALQVRGSSGIISNATATWTSSTPAVATVSQSGVLNVLGTTNDSIVVTASRGEKAGRFRFFAWPTLANDSPLSVSAGADQSRWYLTRTTASTARLTVTLTGGDGDADLYVWTPGTWESAQMMCESFSTTNTETCVIENPQAGLWSIEVYGFQPYSNVQVRAVVTAR